MNDLLQPLMTCVCVCGFKSCPTCPTAYLTFAAVHDVVQVSSMQAQLGRLETLCLPNKLVPGTGIV